MNMYLQAFVSPFSGSHISVSQPAERLALITFRRTFGTWRYSN